MSVGEDFFLKIKNRFIGRRIRAVFTRYLQINIMKKTFSFPMKKTI